MITGTRKSLATSCVVLLLLGLSVVTALNDNFFVNRTDYTYYCSGNCNNPRAALTPPALGIVLMGGGTDVDAAYIWMIEKAGGGDWVVLRTSGDGAYNDYILQLSQQTATPLNSVSTFVLKNRNASFDNYVVNMTRNASALYLAGGDQWTYYNYWKGSPLQGAILNSIYQTRPIGGTSAGNAAQPQIVYTGQQGSAISPESLRNPYNEYVTFGVDFINSGGFLQNMITDTHFYQRDRMGRLVTFVSRLATDSLAPLPQEGDSTYAGCKNMQYGVRGIGVDEATALLIDSDYSVSITSWDVDGSAYLLCLDQVPKECTPGTPLSVKNVNTVRLTGNATALFDLQTWSLLAPTSSHVASYALSVDKGQLSSSQSNGKIY